MEKIPVLLVDVGALFGALYPIDPVEVLGNFRLAVQNAALDVNAQEVVTCFDGANHIKYRQQIYPLYKSKRPPKTSQQMEALRSVYRMCGPDARNWHRQIHGDMEADDCIASFVHQAAPLEKFKMYILSNDRDLYRLLQYAEVTCLHSADGVLEHVNRERVEERLGIRLEQFEDYKLLTGDSSDDVSGVPGVGEKTACLWLNEYGSFENIVKNFDSVKMRKNVRETFRRVIEDGSLMQMRAVMQLRTDVPLDYEFAGEQSHLRAMLNDWDSLESTPVTSITSSTKADSGEDSNEAVNIARQVASGALFDRE